MIKRFKHIFFFFAILFGYFANLKLNGKVQTLSDSGNFGKGLDSMPGFDKSYDLDDDYFSEPSPDEITPDFMQDQLKSLIYNPDGTDNTQGQDQLIEQYKMIAEISGEANPESFAKKMLEETKSIVKNENALKEFGQTASSMVKSELGASDKKEKTPDKKTDDLMPDDEFKKRIYADDQSQEKSKLFKKEEKKYEKKYRNDCQNWQKIILENNLDKNRGKLVYRSALNCLKQQWLSIQDSLNKNISAKDEEKISVLKNQMDNFIQNMQIMNRGFYLEVLYKPEFLSLRQSIVDMSVKIEEMGFLVDDFENNFDDEFVERGENKEDFFASLDKSSKSNFLSEIKIDDFEKFVSQASSKLDNFIFGKAITEAIAKKKKLMLLSESMVKHKDNNTYQNYNNNLNNNYSNYPGGYGSPYKEFNRPISDYGRYNDWGDYDKKSNFNDSPKNSSPSSDSSTGAPVKQKQKKKDDFNEFIKNPGVILLKEISQIKVINHDNLKKITQGYFQIDPSYINSQIEDYVKKNKKNNQDEDSSEQEGENKDQNSQSVENENLKTKLKKFLVEVQPGLELLVDHPSKIIFPERDENIQAVNKKHEAKINKFLTMPFIKEFDQNVQTKFEQLKKDLSISSLHTFIASLHEVADEISKKQSEFKKTLSFASQESETKNDVKVDSKALSQKQKKSSFRQSVFQAKLDLEKSCLQKIDSRLSEFEKFEDEDFQDKDLVQVYKKLEELVFESVDVHYNFPVLGRSEVPVEFESKFLKLSEVSRSKARALVAQKLESLDSSSGKNDFFNYVVSNFQDAFEGLGLLENEKVKTQSDYKRFARGINVLNRLWRVNLSFRFAQNNYENWKEFFADVLNYADVEFKVNKFDGLSKDVRKKMWLNTDLRTKAYIPDFIVFWCMGLEDQINHDALFIERGFADQIAKKNDESKVYVQALELDEIKFKLFNAFSERIEKDLRIDRGPIQKEAGESVEESDIAKRFGKKDDLEMAFQVSLIPMIRELRKSFYYYISKDDYFDITDFVNLDPKKFQDHFSLKLTNSSDVISQFKLLNLVNFILFVKNHSDKEGLKLKGQKVAWAIDEIKSHYGNYTGIYSSKINKNVVNAKTDFEILNALRRYLFLDDNLASLNVADLDEVFDSLYSALKIKFVNIIPELIMIDKLSFIFEDEKINPVNPSGLISQLASGQITLFNLLKTEINKLKKEKNKKIAEKILKKLKEIEKKGPCLKQSDDDQAGDDSSDDQSLQEGFKSDWTNLFMGMALLTGGLIAGHYSGVFDWLKEWWKDVEKKQSQNDGSNKASSPGDSGGSLPPAESDTESDNIT